VGVGWSELVEHKHLYSLSIDMAVSSLLKCAYEFGWGYEPQ